MRASRTRRRAARASREALAARRARGAGRAWTRARDGVERSLVQDASARAETVPAPAVPVARGRGFRANPGRAREPSSDGLRVSTPPAHRGRFGARAKSREIESSPTAKNQSPRNSVDRGECFQSSQEMFVSAFVIISPSKD